MLLIHPMQMKTFPPPVRTGNPLRPGFAGLLRPAELAYAGKTYGMHGGFFDDLGSTLWDGVDGLTTALGSALNAIVHTVEQIAQTIRLVVEACIGQVSWNDVLGSLGKTFQDIGQVLVSGDPLRTTYNWLATAPLTAHAFHELDKFTGGLLTGVTNLSDLPGRAMRGDPISKVELIQDALAALQVVMMIVTFPVGLGIMVGMMLGKEICNHQTEAKDACNAAFIIAGAAVGGWSETWGASDDQMLDAEFNALPANATMDQVDASVTPTFSTYLQSAASNYMTAQGIGVVTQRANFLCQSDKWATRDECRILTTIAGDYAKSGGDVDWVTFLATEVGKLGVQQLMITFLPQGSPERVAIEKNWIVQTTPAVPAVAAGSSNMMKFLLLIGGATLLMAGVE